MLQQPATFTTAEVERFQARLRESEDSRYALWLQTFYPKQNATQGPGIMEAFLRRPTPPAQQRARNYPQSACVLTSEQCITALEEKAEEKKRKQEEKEERMREREKKRQEKAAQKEAAKKTKGKQVVLDTTSFYLDSKQTSCDHLCTSFLVGRQQRRKQQEAMTPPSHDVQPAPCFTSADVKRYQRRLEEGYDVPDPHYLLWLQSIGINPAGAHSTTPPSTEASTATPDDASKSLCQTGDCGHPRARLWIACDQCQRWYHCLCAGVSDKKSQVRALRMLSLLLDTRLTIYTTILTLIHLLSSIHDRRTPFYPRPIIDVSTTSGLAGVAPSLRREFLRNFVLEQDMNTPKWIRCKRKITW